jgi:hypothetical protein
LWRLGTLEETARLLSTLGGREGEREREQLVIYHTWSTKQMSLPSYFKK